jgi:hypothetical protein
VSLQAKPAQSCLVALALLVLFITGRAHAQAAGEPRVAAPEDLYVLSIKDRPAEHGKTLDMVFREIKREPDSSLVDIEISGEDKSAWVPMLQGMCGLMQARLHKSAISEQISVQPLRFLLTFPDNPKIDDRRAGPPRLVLTEKECSAIARPP